MAFLNTAWNTAAGGTPPAVMSGGDMGRGDACVLVPVGSSAAGESKLQVAAAQARAAATSIVLLHVLPETAPRPDGSVLPAEAHARTYLDTLAIRLRAGGAAAQTLLRSGPVDTTVADVARELGAKLIVIGSDTTSALARVLPGRRRGRHGGYAATIMRAAPCPVMLVRPSLDGAVEPAAVRRFEADAARAGPVEPRALGHRTVDVARIVGVAGDAGAAGGSGGVAADFRPLRRTRDEQATFRRTVRAMEREAVLPTVELRKLGYGYYVAAEPPQVAAAKHLGRRQIDAVVTEYASPRDEVAWHALDARLAFERTTGLTRVGAARPDTYAGIEALVREFGAGHGISDVREAAMRWYAAVFRPLQVRIRERRLHEWFPGERSAEVVLRVARFDAAGGRRATTWETLLDDFIAVWGRRGSGSERAA